MIMIYNLNKQTKHFSEVCTDQTVSEILGNPTVLISEKISVNSRLDVYDTITYGINPETFEHRTPICSEMEQRLIPVYTEEQVEELKKNLQQ